MYRTQFIENKKENRISLSEILFLPLSDLWIDLWVQTETEQMPEQYQRMVANKQKQGAASGPNADS